MWLHLILVLVAPPPHVRSPFYMGNSQTPVPSPDFSLGLGVDFVLPLSQQEQQEQEQQQEEPHQNIPEGNILEVLNLAKSLTKPNQTHATPILTLTLLLRPPTRH